MKVAVLSGGVGGARFVRALVERLDPQDVTVIGNVGRRPRGARPPRLARPRLDPYALAGLNDEERGWGRADETWNALEEAARFGGEDWFRLGDRDIGLHLVRTQALRAGEPLSAVTARLAPGPGSRCVCFPPPTTGSAPGSRLRPARFRSRSGSSRAAIATRSTPCGSRAPPRRSPRPVSSEALDAADLILIAPSNPYVSIAPILAVGGIRAALERRRVPCVAVSPLIGGAAVKGPADRMLARLAGGTTPAHVASCYPGLIDVLVIDEADAPADLDVETVVTRTLMTDAEARRRLAEAALGAAGALR